MPHATSKPNTDEPSSPYFPLTTNVQFTAKLGSLPNQIRMALLEESKTWKDSTKVKKGSAIRLPDGVIPNYFKLAQSIIKIENDLYIIHSSKIKNGQNRKIKELENLSTGHLYFIKIQYISPYMKLRHDDLLNDCIKETETLLDAGMCLGKTQRIQPSDTNGLNYSVKHYTIMPNLGLDLQELFTHHLINPLVIPDDVRFKIAINSLWELSKFHSGESFISGVGRMHRDIQPANMVLTDFGVRLIDFGFAEEHPEQYIYGNVGTSPYIIKIPKENDSEFSYDDSIQRSGMFFDLDAMRRVLYAPLCYESTKQIIKNRASIFTPSLVDNYELDRYLERAFHITYHMQVVDEGLNVELYYGEYVEEHDLKINNPTTLAAVLIGSQIQLSHDTLSRIINDLDLATNVVGTYFSYPEKWLLHGDTLLTSVLSMSKYSLSQRAQWIRLGLSHDLSTALKNRPLCDALDSNIPYQTKRAIVCLFKRNLWNETAYTALKANPNLAYLCLKAHYYNNKTILIQLLNAISPAEITTSPIAPQDNIKLALTYFDLTHQNINLIHEHEATLNWLYQPYMSAVKGKSQERQNLDNGARLHLFLNNQEYRKAISLAHAYLSTETIEEAKLIRAVLLNVDIESACTISVLSSLLPIQSLWRVYNMQLLHLSEALLFKQHICSVNDFLWLLENETNHQLIITALLQINTPLCRTVLNQLIVRQQTNEALLNRLVSTLENENDLNKRTAIWMCLLSEKAISTYFFENKSADHKIAVVSLCFADPASQTHLIHLLRNKAFLRASTVLSRLDILTIANLTLLSKNKSICNEISQSEKKYLLDCHDAEFVKLKLICSQFDIDTKELEKSYPILILLLIELNEYLDNVRQFKYTALACINVYQALHEIQSTLNDNDEQLTDRQSIIGRVNNILNQNKMALESLQTNNKLEFLACVKENMLLLNLFAKDPTVINLLSKMKRTKPELAYRKWSFFSDFSHKEIKASTYLHTMRREIDNFMHNLTLKSYSFQNISAWSCCTSDATINP